MLPTRSARGAFVALAVLGVACGDPTLAKAYFNAALIYDYYLPDAGKAREFYQKFVENGGDPAKLPKDTANSVRQPQKEVRATAGPKALLAKGLFAFPMLQERPDRLPA